MLNIDAVRTHFPALASGATFFDNPGGTQVAQEVIERMQRYFLHSNANHGGAFRTSQASDAVVWEAREAVAAFLHAARPEEIIFGQNMTSLTFHISRSIARLLEPGDELVVTRLDHDANIAPWLLIAEDRGCQVRWVDFHPEDCTLDMQVLEEAISPRTKLVAVGYASNAVGTINDVQKVVQIAHSAGALCFVDAVQYAPHKSIDVQALDCDLLACSAYKFFGPHTGILYGKYELLERLTAYKVRPAENHTPDKFETGTQSFESIAGVLGALEYLAWLGTTYGPEDGAQGSTREQALRAGMQAIENYESSLSLALLEGLQTVPGLHIWGITDAARIASRVPTFSFTLPGWDPSAVAERLAREEIYVWSGNFYALAALERLGLDEQGGIVRVGLVHYNTRAEIDRLIAILKTL
ncbi:cysteine desulfurase-like protein [Dictyobacter formicarum]|uniref:Cysteine desulfurase-like protein n=1 Tax=Dictyobacter formicarum TaxID=2778368 RepID=A0ABQ3VC83_9CHLR|nr:cysteine desulfurase-like protein [Dictyobacter formicarum]GHO83512.1 cysteine desulfurase-like protein [Dictyobacter formicarum]